MEKNLLLRKCLAVGIILFFVGTSIIPSTAQDKEKTFLPISNGHWLYVGGSGPGNYSKIQDAINAAFEGDTVFVYDESSPYYENVVIDKPIFLNGENKETTIIDGNANNYVIKIVASDVQVSGFTVYNCEDWKSNIYLYSVHDCLITDNIIIGNDFGQIDGIDIEYSDKNIIQDNNIIHFYQNGIHLYVSSNNIVEENTVKSCYYRGIIIHYYSNNNSIFRNTCINTGTGIDLFISSANNTVYNNTIFDSREGGIFLYVVSGNYIYYNEIFNNSFGIGFQYSSNNNITENIISDNSMGIKNFESTRNNIINNTIIDNQRGIFIDYRSSTYYIFGNNISNNTIGIELSSTTQHNISTNLMSNIQSNILLEESYNNIIFQNTIRDALIGIQVLHSLSNYIIKNTLSNNLDYGIYLNESSNLNLVSSNHFEKNKNYGIKTNFSNLNVFISNTFEKNKCGISIENCNNSTISDNTFTKNTYGIQLHKNSSNNTIKTNIIKRNSCGILVTDSSENTFFHNEIIANRGFNLFSGGIKFINSFNNNITQNNFKRNVPNARFIFSNNTWYNNYWGHPRLIKKSIFGIGSEELPWINYDYYPSFLPYNIVT